MYICKLPFDAAYEIDIIVHIIFITRLWAPKLVVKVFILRIINKDYGMIMATQSRRHSTKYVSTYSLRLKNNLSSFQVLILFEDKNSCLNSSAHKKFDSRTINY